MIAHVQYVILPLHWTLYIIKVVDFLILVGGLEDSSKSKGDSAEVALLVCDSNVEKV